jgi:hypothetical protein
VRGWQADGKGSGNGGGLIEVVSRHLPRGLSNTMKNLSQNNRCPNRDSKRAPSEHKSGVLPPDQPGHKIHRKYIK